MSLIDFAITVCDAVILIGAALFVVVLSYCIVDWIIEVWSTEDDDDWPAGDETFGFRVLPPRPYNWAEEGDPADGWSFGA